MSLVCLADVRCQDLARGQLAITQHVAEITEVPSGGEAAQLVVVAQGDQVQAERGARGEQVKDAACLLITHRQHTDLDGNGAVLAVIGDGSFVHPFGGNQLPDQTVIVDVDVVYQPVDLDILPKRGAHQGAQGGCIGLEACHAAANRKSACSAAQQTTNLDRFHFP